MIDGPAMVALLGKASDVAEVKNLVKQLGAKDPKLKRGDTSAYVVADKLGLELVFEDEVHVTKRKDLAIGKGKLFLNSITFKTADPPKVKAYAGTLPHKIAFSSSQADLKKLLGKPEESDPDLALDRWLVNGHWVFARYDDKFSELVDVSVAVPTKS